MKSKILFFDVETLPNLAYVWGKYEQNVIAFKQEWQLASFAWKWAGTKEVHCISQRTKSEKQLVVQLKELLDEADIVIAHNGDRFDNLKANAKFIEYGLTPPSPYSSVDTRKVAKGRFLFNSNKLDDLGHLLKVGRKLQTGGFDLWLDCIAGKSAAWKKMEKYNKQDVLLLERVYNKLRPWVKNHPRIALDEVAACANCGSTKLVSNGIRATSTQIYRRYQCISCGAWHRARVAEKSKKIEIVGA